MCRNPLAWIVLLFRHVADLLLRLQRTAQRKIADHRHQNGGGGETSSSSSANRSAATMNLGHLRAGPRKLLVLDLDETLVHSTTVWSAGCHFTVTVRLPPQPQPQPQQQPISRSLDDSVGPYTPSKHRRPQEPAERPPVILFVSKRPHLDFFLRRVAAWYDVAVFTSSSEAYASQVIDRIDPKRKLIRRRLYRSACTEAHDGCVKDLRTLTEDLSRVLIVDNSAAAFTLNPANALPIATWIDDPDDEALLDLLPFLHALRFVEDVRSILGLRLLFANDRSSNATPPKP